MDTDDSVEKLESGETSKDISLSDAEQHESIERSVTVSGSDGPEEKDVSSVLTTETLRVTVGDWWAELDVTWSWSADGTQFTCNATRYRVRDAGGNKGNIWLGITSASSWGPVDIANDGAIQDGTWRPITGGATVAGNSASGVIFYKQEFDKALDDPWASVTVTKTFVLPPPVIGPNKNFTASTFNVTGTGGIAGANMVLDHGAGTLATRVQPSGGAWSVPVTVADTTNSQRIQAYQQVGGRNSARTGYITAYRAKLTSPTNNSIMPAKDFKFTGVAAPNTSVRVVEGGIGTAWSSTANTGGTSQWQAAPLPIFSTSGGKYITAELDGIQHYTVHITFHFLGYPVITNTQLTVPLDFTLTGRNRLSGATVTAYIGPSNTVVGTASAATTDTFSITTTNLDPGAHALTVEQFHSSKGSGRSAAVTFNVKPNPPTVTSTTTGERVKLHGTGFKNGKMHFHQPGNDTTPLFDVDIKPDGTFEHYVPQAQLPGPLAYSCRQSVLGVGTARIYSDGWVQLQPTVPTPAPTQVAGTRDGQKLVFSGRGMRWGPAQVVVVIFNNGQDMRPGVPSADVPDSLAWTTQSTGDVAPGTYTQLTAQMWVNNQYSLPVPVPAVIIPSPPPVLTPITGPTGQRPQISGTMWNGSTVVVSVTGRPAETATTTGASFYLNATSDWAPGTYTVSVTAAFGGQTSTAATQSLTVRTPQPQIETSGPVPLIATINGKGWAGCRVKIFTTIGNQELGADDVKPDGTFEIILLKQAAGEQTLYAVQYESGNPANASVESERVAVKFGVPTADVTVPAEGGKTPRVSTFSGTTTAKSGTVELWLGSTLLADKIAITNGIWSAPGIKLDAGLKAVLVYIRDGNDLSVATTRNVIVVPEKLKIDSPLTGQNIGRQLWVSGVGAFPGDEVIVKRLGVLQDFTPVLVDEHGHWATQILHNMVANDTLAATARAGAELDSDMSDPITPKLLHAPQHITQPRAGDRVGTKPVFAGLVRPRATVTIAQWFNNASVLATTVADAHGYWEVQSTVALAEGGAWFQMRDTLNAQPSEWRRSERFEVKAAVADFAAPILGFPLEMQEVGLQSVLSGRGLPGAKVLVYDSLRQQVLGEFLVARDGSWSGTLNKQFPPGDLVCSVRQQRDGVYSKWMVPDRTFKVIQVPAGFAKPVILKPENNPRNGIEPNPEIAGTGFPGAKLKVYFHTTATVIAETTVQANGHWVTRCKSDLAEGSHQLAAQQELDGKVSAWSDIIINVKVRPHPSNPVCTSPTDDEDVSRNLVVQGRAMPGATLDLYWIPSGSYLGTAIANADGFWIIKLYGLPLDESRYKARAMFVGAVSEWTPEIKVNIHDFG